MPINNNNKETNFNKKKSVSMRLKSALMGTHYTEYIIQLLDLEYIVGTVDVKGYSLLSFF